MLPDGAGLCNGGGGGNRTRVRRSYTKGVYMLIPVFTLALRDSTGRDSRRPVLLELRVRYAGSPVGYPTEMTIHPNPWERRGGSVAGY